MWSIINFASCLCTSLFRCLQAILCIFKIIECFFLSLYFALYILFWKFDTAILKHKKIFSCMWVKRFFVVISFPYFLPLSFDWTSYIFHLIIASISGTLEGIYWICKSFIQIQFDSKLFQRHEPNELGVIGFSDAYYNTSNFKRRYSSWWNVLIKLRTTQILLAFFETIS